MKPYQATFSTFYGEETSDFLTFDEAAAWIEANTIYASSWSITVKRNDKILASSDYQTAR